MFELTHKHLELITSDVSRADISYSHLKYDLIDHICCDLEREMSQGIPFEKAYAMVKKRIGIRGLQQIQEDTLFLIDKKYRIMKNTMKIFGVVAPIIMAFGSLFKIEHWPGAGILLTLGFFLLCFVFLPSAVYVSYREVSNRKKLLAHLSGFMAAFLFAISFLFKIQHWPMANIFMLIAAVISGLFFIPAFFINQLKVCPKNQRIAYIFGFIGSLAYLIGFLFKVNHWPGAIILTQSGSIFLMFIAFPIFIVSHYKNYEHISSRFIFLTFAMLWFILPTSLIAITISGDVFQGFKSNGADKEYNIQYLTSKDNALAAELVAGSSAESIKSKEIVTQIKKNSDELVDYIQRIKFKIISLVKGVTISPSPTINFEDIDISNKDASEQILVKEGEAKNLQEKIEIYKLSVSQNTGIDSITANFVTKILAIAPAKETQNLSRTWGNLSLITTLNRLSTFQESIRTAEKIIFRSLSKKTTPKQLLISSN